MVNFRQCEDAVTRVAGDTAANAQSDLHCHAPVADDTTGHAQSDLHFHGPVADDTAGNSQSDLHCRGPSVQSRQLQYTVTPIVTTRDCGTSTDSDAVLNDVNQDENVEAGNGDSVKGSCAIQVAVTNNEGHRRHDKKHFCKFCMKAFLKLPRHFMKKHRYEPEVAALKCMPLYSTRRKMHLRKLMNDGNYQHNVDVLAKRRGEIMPHRRPSHSSDYEQFSACKYCRAMFVKRHLWKHKKNCPFKPSSQTDESGYRCQRSTESGANTAAACDISNNMNCQITVQRRQAEEVAQDENAEASNGHSVEGRRRRDKKQFCKFCMKALTKLPCHLIKKHSSEPEVATLKCMSLKSTMRKMRLRKLLNDGNYQHNIDVLAKGTGEIIPHRRSSCSSDYEEFTPCEYCRAMFVKCQLWKHKKNCPFKPSSQTDESDAPVCGHDDDGSKEEQHMTLSLSCDVDTGEYHCKLRACAGISK